MSETAIRHPKRGQAHRPSKWVDTSVGFSWQGRRVVATACGFGDGGTIRRMSEEIEIDRVDPDDRCKRCWPETPPTTARTRPTRAADQEDDRG